MRVQYLVLGVLHFLIHVLKASDDEDDDDNDDEWRRTFDNWRKQHPAPKPRPTPRPIPRPTPRPMPRQRQPAAGPSTATSGPSQTRAQPVWMDSDARAEDDITDAQSLARRTRYWQDLLRDILERFPHPDLARRPTVTEVDVLLAPGIPRTRQYHTFSLVSIIFDCNHLRARR